MNNLTFMIKNVLVFSFLGLLLLSHSVNAAVYDFGGLDANDSGGAGFKTLTNPNLIVSNVMIQDGTDIYPNDTLSTSITLVFKADDVDAASFDVTDFIFKNYNVGADPHELTTSSTVTFKDDGGSPIQVLTLNSAKVLSTSPTSIFTFFDNNVSSPVVGVSSIEVALDLTSPRKVETTNFVSIELDNIVAPSANTAPVTANLNGDSFTYSSGSGAQVIDQTTAVTLTDAESTDFDGGNLTVTITSGEDASEDLLGLDTSGAVSLQGTTAGSNVSVSATTVGTLGNNIAEGNDLVINFNADATPALAQTLLRAVTYENTDTGLTTTGARNVRVTVNDGDGGTSTNADVTVTVSKTFDSDASLTASAGVSEPVNLPFSIDTAGEAVDLFDFTISDGGTSDNVPLLVTQVVVNVSGTTSDADRAKVTWRLNGNDTSNVVGVYSAGADTITFSGLMISVADGASETYTINGYYNDNTGLTHGQTVILSTDGDTDVTIGANSTSFGTTSAVTNSSGTQFIDDVEPVITSVNVPANATYTSGANLDFDVNFDDNVVVNTTGGFPRIAITVGAVTRYATYLAGSGSNALVFRYTIPIGDEDLNGISIGLLELNNGTLKDVNGNDATLTLNSVGSTAQVKVDAQDPVVAEVTAVVSPGSDSTPDVTISSSEAGTLSVGGSCGSIDEGAIGSGNTIITLTQTDNSTPLASGTYSDCTVTVADLVGNVSNVLTLTLFELDATNPTVDTNAGQSANEAQHNVIIGNTKLSSSDNVSPAGNITYTLVSAPSNGTLKNNGAALSGGGTFTQAQINAGQLTYDHDGSETVSDTFTFRVTDGAGNTNDNGTANFTFTLTIAAINDAPATTVDADTTNEDSAVMIDVLANDSDIDGSLNAASVAVVLAPSHGGTSVNSGTGVITYTPTADYSGADSFTYTVEDNNGLVSTATTVTVTVNPVNDAPIAVADSASTGVNTLVSIDVAANDTDIDSGDSPDPTTIVVVGAASNGSAVFNGGTNRVDYTPNASYSGSDSFTYTIDDGTGATSNVATVAVTVATPNTAPSANSDSATTNEDTPVTISVLANDSDADGSIVASSVQLISSGTNGSASVNSAGLVTYTPTANYFGSDSFSYRVSDDDGASSNTATVSVTITAVNDLPVISGVPTAKISRDTAYSFIPSASDQEQDTLTFEITNKPSWSAFDTETGALTGTPTADDVGISSNIVISVSDGNELVSLPPFSIEVTSSNDAPVAMDASYELDEDTSLAIELVMSDSDESQTLTAQIESQPLSGTLAANGKMWLYTPNGDFNGADSFTYKVFDGELYSEISTVSLNIKAINDAPVAQDDSFTLPNSADNRYELAVLANDSDVDLDDKLTIIGASSSLGSVSVIDNKLVYLAPEGAEGVVELNYLLQDTSKEGDSADVTLSISANDDESLPVLTLPDDIEINAEGLFTKVDIGTATAVDVEGNPIPVSLVETSNIFAPGHHVVHWRAEDAEGRVSIKGQGIKVRPLISIAKDAYAVEGNQHSVGVYLNGDSPSYPVTIPYTIGGSADASDHDLVSGELAIEQGVIGTISFNIFDDSQTEADETLEIVLGGNINLGSKSAYRLTIVENNVAPQLSASISQLGEMRTIVTSSDDMVTVALTVEDVNPDDSHTVVWQPDNGLMGGTGSVDKFTFNPLNMTAGIYKLKVIVTDSGVTPLSASQDIYIEIVESLAVLTDQDTDGDLIPDDQEGFTDSDQDGIPDYLDAIAECNVLPEQVSNSEQFLIEGEPGVCLRKGSTIVGNETGGSQLLLSELPSDDSAENRGGVFDFIATGLPVEGQSFSLVLPQRLAIPENAIYRKLRDGTWSDFVVDSSNSISSASGEPGYCPPPGDLAWSLGLSEGHWCVQLTIQDGGPNDDDGIANGTVVDPGGVAVPMNNNNTPVAIADEVTMSWNSTIIIDVLSNDSDEDNDALEVSSASVDFGLVSIEDNKVVYQSLSGFFGTATIQYSVSDNQGGTAHAWVSVNIMNNMAPIANDDLASTDDRTAITIAVLANDTDAENDELSLVAATTSEGTVVINDDQTLTYIPTLGFEGTANIMYTIADVEGKQSQANAIVNVSKYVPVEVVNKSSGGAVSWYLLLVLPFIYLRRARQISLLIALCFASIQAQANWFVDVELGYANADTNAISSPSSVDVSSLDDADASYSVGVGYQFTSRWAISARYINLGETSVTLSSDSLSPSEYHKAVAGISPILGDGWGLDVNYAFWQSDTWFASVRAGGYWWESDIESYYNNSMLSTNISGSDWYAGLGIGYKFAKHWSVDLSATRYFIDNDVDNLGLGLTYCF